MLTQDLKPAQPACGTPSALSSAWICVATPRQLLSNPCVKLCCKANQSTVAPHCSWLLPVCLQRLVELLQLREIERQQRLRAAATTSSAVAMQQQHVKAAASAIGSASSAGQAAAAKCKPEPELRAAPADCSVAFSRQTERCPVCISAAAAAPTCNHSDSRGVSSSGRLSVVCNMPGADTSGPPQLPSTAASAVAAIAAAGGSPRRELPSRLERSRVSNSTGPVQALHACNGRRFTATVLRVSGFPLTAQPCGNVAPLTRQHFCSKIILVQLTSSA